ELVELDLGADETYGGERRLDHRHDEGEDHELDGARHDGADRLLREEAEVRGYTEPDEHTCERGDQIELHDGQEDLHRHQQERQHDGHVHEAEDDGVEEVEGADVGEGVDETFGGRHSHPGDLRGVEEDLEVAGLAGGDETGADQALRERLNELVEVG